MTDKEKLALAIAALHKIANCDEGNLVTYCRKVDLIALDALIALED